MRNRKAAFFSALFFLFLFSFFRVPAQERDLLDRDPDSLFDEPLPAAEDSGEEAPPSAEEPQGSGAGGNVLTNLLRRVGFSLEAYYFFFGGFTPGWDKTPWHGARKAEFSNIVGAGMNSGLVLDFQLSEYLRVKNDFRFSFPGFAFDVNELFLDYNLYDFAYFRLGKYFLTWGLSPNFPYTNLLARLPSGSSGGDSYIFKANIPIGIGGFEVLAMTRDGYVVNMNRPRPEEIGYGGKLNMASPWADVDIGAFYLKAMPMRTFVSVKSTIWNTEIYAEGLASIGDPKFSANIGLIRSFFGDRLRLNGEFFYNGETGGRWYNRQTDLTDAETVPFIKGYNLAFNAVYNTGFLGLRFFTQCLYSVNENSIQLVPGLSIDPVRHVQISAAIPMVLGSANGTYYTNNADKYNRPFSLVLLVSISGSYRYSHSD